MLEQSEDTFARLNVHNNDKFLLVTAGKALGFGPSLVWCRFRDTTKKYSDSHIHANGRDTLIFKARVDCTVTGLLWPREQDKKDHSINFRYRMSDGGPMPGWEELGQLTTRNDELDEERGLHLLEFKEFGIDAIPMSEGQKIEFEMKNPE